MRYSALALAFALVAAPLPGRSAGAAPYTVRPGDTLYSVARALGTTVDELLRLNGLASPELKAGQTIVVPDPPAAPPVAQRHTVAAGENLYRIAARYGLTVPTLQQANALAGASLKVGQVLIIPAGGVPPAADAQTIETARTADTAAGGLTGLPPLGDPPAPPPQTVAPEPTRAPSAPPFERLLPPPASAALPDLLPEATATTAGPDGAPVLLHTVAARETLFGLGRRYGVDPVAIRELNGLRGDAIAVGQVLRVPVGGTRPAEPGATGPRAVTERYLGVAYRFGGTTPSGLDCSGFTGLVMAELGVTLPRTSRDQFAVGAPVERAELREGDLVFFDTAGGGAVSHVGIFLGGQEFVHAATSPAKVIVSRLDEPYYASRYLGARRALAAPAGDG